MYRTLVHNGVAFPPPYVRQGFHNELSDLAEEMMFAYSQKLGKPVINQLFNTNFYKCLQPELPDKYQHLPFPDADFFQSILIQMQSAPRSHTSPSRSVSKEQYGYAIVNGKSEPLNNYIVEPPGIFIGRGNSPYTGLWKYRVQPEDIIINFISTTVQPPEPSVGGHWKAIISNPRITYIARYIENIGNTIHRAKEVRFASTSSIIHSSDTLKFKYSDVLLKNWNLVQAYIMKSLGSPNRRIQECALIAWLIQHTSIRIGSEETENGVVGASTLKVNNICIKDNTITLHFIGKDSVEYTNTFAIPVAIIRVLKRCMKGKHDNENVFNVSAKQVNHFLGICLPHLTAKVFRTALAKRILLSLYKPKQFNKSWPVEYKVLKLKLLLVKVSQLLNHRKSTTSSDKHLSHLQEQLNIKLERLKILRKSGKHLDRVLKLEWKIQILQLRIEFTEQSHDINLNTALTNYINPNIISHICKTKNIPIDKIYSQTLIKRFRLQSCN